MSYNAFILQDHYDDPSEPDNIQGVALNQWMVWVQSPAGAWLLLQGNWPTKTSALRFVDRTGYQLIDSAQGLRQLDKQLAEQQRNLRSTLHLRSVH